LAASVAGATQYWFFPPTLGPPTLRPEPTSLRLDVGSRSSLLQAPTGASGAASLDRDGKRCRSSRGPTADPDTSTRSAQPRRDPLSAGYHTGRGKTLCISRGPGTGDSYRRALPALARANGSACAPPRTPSLPA